MESRFETHGDFSWCELLTNDVEKAKEFYRAIFGWQITRKLCPAWLASSRAAL